MLGSSHECLWRPLTSFLGSRVRSFDLIYLVLDQPNEQRDRRLAKHIVSLYYDVSPRHFCSLRPVPARKHRTRRLPRLMLTCSLFLCH